MIRRAQEIVLFDLFPGPLERFAPLLAQAHARKVVVAGLAYAAAPALPFLVISSAGAATVAERWPGQRPGLVADAREHLTALLGFDSGSVRYAVASDSVGLGRLKHWAWRRKSGPADCAVGSGPASNGVSLLRAFPPGLRALMGPPKRDGRRRRMRRIAKLAPRSASVVARRHRRDTRTRGSGLRPGGPRHVAWAVGQCSNASSVHEKGRVETSGLEGRRNSGWNAANASAATRTSGS